MCSSCSVFSCLSRGKTKTCVRKVYSNLSASITSRSWSTKTVPLKLGVYQRDPLLVVIFNTVMIIFANTLKEDQNLGYIFTQSYHSVNVLEYADNTCLIANSPGSCQHLLAKVKKWLQWSGIRVKVTKCHNLAIQAGISLNRRSVVGRHVSLSSRPPSSILQFNERYVGVKKFPFIVRTTGRAIPCRSRLIAVRLPFLYVFKPFPLCPKGSPSIQP